MKEIFLLVIEISRWVITFRNLRDSQFLIKLGHIKANDFTHQSQATE
jgi:hypothetical protein